MLEYWTDYGMIMASLINTQEKKKNLNSEFFQVCFKYNFFFWFKSNFHIYVHTGCVFAVKSVQKYTPIFNTSKYEAPAC